MRQYPYRRGNALFDFFASRLEMDHLFATWLAAFLSAIGVLSLFAGFAVWPTVFSLRGLESILGSIASALCGIGLLAVLICFVLALFLTLWQRREFRLRRLLLLNVVLYGTAFTLVMIAQMKTITTVLPDTFSSTLLWLIISPFFGYILSVLPALIGTAVIGLVYRILDAILPD